MNNSLLYFKICIKVNYFVYFSHILLHFQTKYILDSFIELIPLKKGNGADHYIAYQRINQIWLGMDDATVRKAYLGKKFRINLAFFRNTTTTLPLVREYDFAQFRQMPKPSVPRNVASLSAIDLSKLKPIPFILDSSVPECDRQPDNVQDMGDQEQKTEQETPLKADPPEVPQKCSKDKKDEHETQLETDPLHVPETDTQEQETENETPREESPHDVPEKDNQEAQPEHGTEPSQDSAENSPKLVGHIELLSVDEFKKELAEKVMTPKFLVVRLPKYPNLLK